MPADFTRDADLKFPLGSMEQEICDAVGPGDAEFLDATKLATDRGVPLTPREDRGSRRTRRGLTPSRCPRLPSPGWTFTTTAKCILLRPWQCPLLGGQCLLSLGLDYAF